MKPSQFHFVAFLTVASASPPMLQQPTATLTQSTHVDLRPRATTAAPAAPPLAPGLCGWVSGNQTQSWFCDNDAATCIIATQSSLKAIGCCPSSGCNSFRTSCFPATVACNDACKSNKANLVCSDPNPFCATFTYPGAFTELRCMPSVPSQLQVAFTYTGFTDLLPLPRIVTSSSACQSGGQCKFGVSIRTQTPSTTGTRSSGNPTTIGGSGAPTTPRKKKSNSNVGAIAGGVVGGVVVLAAIVAAIFYFLAKKKRSRKYEPAFTQDTSNGGQTEEQAYFTGVQKAELPTSPTEPGKKAPVGQNERYEIDGTEQQPDTPLAELPVPKQR